MCKALVSIIMCFYPFLCSAHKCAHFFFYINWTKPTPFSPNRSVCWDLNLYCHSLFTPFIPHTLGPLDLVTYREVALFTMNRGKYCYFKIYNERKMLCWGIGRGFIIQMTIKQSETFLKWFGSIGPKSGGKG